MTGPTSRPGHGRHSSSALLPAFLAYTAATELLFLYGLPTGLAYSRLVSRYPSDFSQRLGVYPSETRAISTGSPRIWIHASSVGEVGVAKAITDALGLVFPNCGLIISTGTFHGREAALHRYAGSAPCVYAPLDFRTSVIKALRWFQPHALVLLETEIWPQWIFQTHKMGIPVILANGRISARSVGTYLRFKSLFEPILRKMAAFSMISQDDADRIRRMGAPSNRIVVNGNAKYDHLSTMANKPSVDVQALVSPESGPVIVAGSTRSGEESAVLDMFARVLRKHPKAVLILAPRHVTRTQELSDLLKSTGMGFQTLSTLMQQGTSLDNPVMLVDQMGCLFDLYSLADVVFCGGSLVELGGQNVMEPASWGKPVFFGPHMDDFAHARDQLEICGGGVTVHTPQELGDRLLHLLDDPGQVKAMGEKARNGVKAHQGASAEHARVIANCMAVSGRS